LRGDITKAGAKKKKSGKNVGSIDGYFSDFLGRAPTQDRKFMVVPVGGPTIVATNFINPLPAGELILFFSFSPTAKHQTAAAAVKVKTAGPFVLWDGYTTPPVTSNSQTMTLSSTEAAGA
jgi:hypothetical protein